MNDIDCLAGSDRRSLCVSEQLEQPHASLQLEPTLIVHRTDHGYLLRVVFFDKDVDLKVFVKLRDQRVYTFIFR